jgi:hypothetical protein
VIADNDRIFKLAGSWATPACTDGDGIVNIAVDVTGIATAEINLASHWLNFTGSALVEKYAHIHTDGFWGSAVDLSNAYMSWAKFSSQLPEAPQQLNIMNLQNATAFDTCTAIYAVNDVALSLGYVTGSVSTVKGSIPFYQGAGGGGGFGYIAIYDVEFA